MQIFINYHGMSKNSALYLIPTPIGEGRHNEVLPSETLNILPFMKHFIVENLRSARRFLKAAGYPHDFDNVWFYEMQSDGFTLDDKRAPLTDNDNSRNYGDLHLIIEAYKKRNPKKESDRTQQHFFVPKTEIEGNSYDLSISKYKEEVYEEIKYDEPRVILEKLHSMEENISKGIKDLKEIIG